MGFHDRSMPYTLPIYHFTNIENLPSILQKGLQCDNRVSERNVEVSELGDRSIKGKRRRKEIPAEAVLGKTLSVGDCVPFYFKPKTSMLSLVIHQGARPEDIVFLTTDIATLQAAGAKPIVTNKNAASANVEFHAVSELVSKGWPKDLIDWDVLDKELYQLPEDEKEKAFQRQRQQAEVLVPEFVSCQRIHAIGVHNDQVAETVRRMTSGYPDIEVRTTPDWFFKAA